MAKQEPTTRRRLGEILVTTGALTPQQLAHALAEQVSLQLPLGQTLIKLRYTTDEVMRQALSTQLGIPYIDLRNVIIDRTLGPLIDPAYARRHALFPVARVGRTLTVAMDDPTAAAVVEELERRTEHTVTVVTSSEQAIQQALHRLYDHPDAGTAVRSSPTMSRPRSPLPPGPYAYGALLGLSPLGFSELLAAVEDGFSYGAFEELIQQTGLSRERAADFADLSLEALSRRERGVRFTRDESDRLLRAARIFSLTLDVFHGDRAVTSAWLLSEQPALSGRVPLDLARTDFGAREVEIVISRLTHDPVNA